MTTITKIDELRGNCTLIAARVISGKSDEEILRVARSSKVNYVDHRGLHNWQWTNLYLGLGMQLGKAMYTHELRDKIPGSRGKDEFGWTRYAGITISKVLEILPEGTHLVTTMSHIFVIQDGKLIDPNFNRACLGRRVTQVVQVLNPHIQERKGLLRLRLPGNKRRRGTRAHRVYEEMKMILRQPMTRDELLSGCARAAGTGGDAYNATDLAWDIKRGNIVEI
jgi:hypothetical protein